MRMWLFLLLGGCSEFDIHGQEEAPGEAQPEIRVTPTILTFGELGSGEVEVQTFTIASVGDAALWVDSIVSDSASFTILSATDPVIAMGESTQIEVAFQPLTARENVGQVAIESNDPVQHRVLVDLIGQGAVPELTITPETHAFGMVPVPCGDAVELLLTNTGLEPLQIDDIALSGHETFSLTDDNVLPLTLAPAQSATVDVAFASEPVGDVSSTLTVLSNDPRGDKTAIQLAEGDWETLQVDEHTFQADQAVDIVFALDRTCSMAAEHDELATAFGAFIGQIDAVTKGWQIGVLSQEDGCFNLGYLGESTPDYITLFQDMVRHGVVNDLSEKLMALTARALGLTVAGECNEGFLRRGALLHLIYVTDEREQSGVPWDDWLGIYADYVDDPSLVMVSAVADLYDACGHNGADGYADAAAATGGLLLDICDDKWGERVDELALASLQAIYEYPLGHQPDVDSIEVYVDGVAWTADWHYAADRNAVVFDVLLEGGQQILIRYGVPADCG
jgi:hypothetical protein